MLYLCYGDPKHKQIRSWLFDSNGGFVIGTWTKKGDRWFVQSVATLAEGSAGSFTSIFRPSNPDSYVWQKVHRIVDGEVLPNIDEVVVTRRLKSETVSTHKTRKVTK